MAKVNEFLIQNPNADFIKLQKILDEVNFPDHKRGDIKFIDSVIDHLNLSNETLKEAYKLLDSLMFRNPIKKDDGN